MHSLIWARPGDGICNGGSSHQLERSAAFRRDKIQAVIPYLPATKLFHFMKYISCEASNYPGEAQIKNKPT
jgi:hypothetical protein